MLIRTLDSRSADFGAAFAALRAWDFSDDSAVNQQARAVLDAVRVDGDAAVLRFTEQFDGLRAESVAELTLYQDALMASLDGIPRNERAALEFAAARVRAYHERQVLPEFEFSDAYGNRLGQRVQPLERVGVYVPGGRAAYPSTVLMTAIPARVAGVQDITMTVPTPGGERNALVLAAAALAGVDRVHCIGGAQAIAALAFGTQSVARVDKIVGPGGAFVAAAKRMVYGHVGIDMIAGPSEIVVIADGSTPAEWVALDLFSQAEHDELAQAILITPDGDYAQRVLQVCERLILDRPRAEIIRASLTARGAVIVCGSLDEAIALANGIAPEHLELAVAEPRQWLPAIRHAGAVFLGARSAEVLGDYVAGPSHVLPTFGTARFSSPLGVYDFQTRTSLIEISARGADALGQAAAILATGEGFRAHADAAIARLGSGQN